MGLNCKPGADGVDQDSGLAEEQGHGPHADNGHVVKCVHMHPESPADLHVWVVDPPQWVVVQAHMRARNGFLVAGSRHRLEGVPDEFLRPFDDLPPEEIERLMRECGFHQVEPV